MLPHRTSGVTPTRLVHDTGGRPDVKLARCYTSTELSAGRQEPPATMVLRALLHLHAGALRVLLVRGRPEQRGEHITAQRCQLEPGRRLIAL